MLIKKRALHATFTAETKGRQDGDSVELEQRIQFEALAEKMATIIGTDNEEVPTVTILGIPLSIKPTLFRVVAVSLITAAGTFLGKEVLDNL